MKACPFCDEPYHGRPKFCRACRLDLYDLFGEFLWDDPQSQKPRRRHVFVSVIGDADYQQELHMLLRTHGSFLLGQLVPEPNEADPDAVAVRIDARKVGYLARHVAAEFSGLLKARGRPVVCPIELRGGSAAKPLIGAVVDFSVVYALAQ